MQSWNFILLIFLLSPALRKAAFFQWYVTFHITWSLNWSFRQATFLYWLYCDFSGLKCEMSLDGCLKLSPWNYHNVQLLKWYVKIQWTNQMYKAVWLEIFHSIGGEKAKCNTTLAGTKKRKWIETEFVLSSFGLQPIMSEVNLSSNVTSSIKFVATRCNI